VGKTSSGRNRDELPPKHIDCGHDYRLRRRTGRKQRHPLSLFHAFHALITLYAFAEADRRLLILAA
jgi:hypothetical protein